MNTDISTEASESRARTWIDWTILALGVLLFISPWLTQGGAVATWNALIPGAVIAYVARVALAQPSIGTEQTNGTIGLWLMIAPWTLGFSGSTDAMWTSVLVGLGVACLAGFQLLMLRPVEQA